MESTVEMLETEHSTVINTRFLYSLCVNTMAAFLDAVAIDLLISNNSLFSEGIVKLLVRMFICTASIPTGSQ